MTGVFGMMSVLTGIMKEALTYIAETGRDSYVRLHVKVLVELVELIVNFLSIVIPSRLTYTMFATICFR
ncbi:MAG: hypothetical protein QW695_01545 [Candidatus Bathyarchaeia archaeon]